MSDVVSMGEGDERLADGLSLRRSAIQPPPRPHWHAHGFHQLSVFLSRPGRIRWQIGEELTITGRPEAGDVIVCPAIVPVLVSWERPFESISVLFSIDLVRQTAARGGLESSIIRPRAMRRDHFAGEVARKLAEDAGAGRELLVESLGTALALHLLTDATNGAGLPKEDPGLRPEDWQRLDAHIQANLDGDLSVARLAALVGLGPHHFIRKFRATTGATPRQYVIRRRVEYAAALIRGGSGIAEAATLAGFSGQSHLHRHIRRWLGVTPGSLAMGPDGFNPPLP